MTTAVEITATDEALLVTGSGTCPQTVTLEGPRARITGQVSGDSVSWRATVPLRAARWGRGELPLPSGSYRLSGVGADGDALALIGDFPARTLAGLRVRVSDDAVEIGPPVDPSYGSGDGQAALERRYAFRPDVLENAVFFESFYGRNASCNPLAIDRELARVAPGITRYWSVVDLSVAVPDGAVAVVEGSPQWWQARAASRLLVVNDWLRRRYVRRPGQRVLQTWHGTPIKRLALHRPGFDPRRMLAVLRESRRWDILLAQNAYAERVLRRAYAFRGPLWVEGNPRNDLLVRADAGDHARIRRALGVDDAARIILYAPTWRDDRTEMVDFLDLDALAAAQDAVILVRGHSRTLAPGRDTAGDRVIDVTSYPDIAELMVVADELITDYSSTMFDFTVTGRPITFFTPDLDHYRGTLRGFYFDLDAYAPGPVCATEEELLTALADPGRTARYAERYARWRERFNARDDGSSAERVVARILDQGLVER